MRNIFVLLLISIAVFSCDENSSNQDIKNEPVQVEEEGENFMQGIKDLGRKTIEQGQKLSKKVKEKWKKVEINGFSIEDDIKMGKQLYDEIHASSEYKVISEKNNGKLYEYIENIKQTILSNGNFKYKEQFEWKITILEDDKTINAFCAPGGYIFIYTGIIQYLDNEAELAGVLAHEMGHAERRHGTRQLTKALGIQILLDFIMRGKNSDYFKQVIGGLINLRYSRSYEREADECSVEYLCKTDYVSDGAAGFFEKIVEEKGNQSAELLSTHPDPEERISNFKSLKKEMNCKGKSSYAERYRKIKKLAI
jgi:predicted Zn-dependent protease